MRIYIHLYKVPVRSKAAKDISNDEHASDEDHEYETKEQATVRRVAIRVDYYVAGKVVVFARCWNPVQISKVVCIECNKILELSMSYFINENTLRYSAYSLAYSSGVVDRAGVY